MRSSLTYYGDPILSSVAEPIKAATNCTELIDKLTEVLKDSDPKWISSKHLGLNSRLIVIKRSNAGDSGSLVLANPEVLEFHGPVLSRVESDLSCPGLHVSVNRRAEATIRFQNESGDDDQQRFAGPNCRLILQAIDQLNGKLMTVNLNRHRRQSIKGYLRHLSKKLDHQTENSQAKNLVDHE